MKRFGLACLVLIAWPVSSASAVRFALAIGNNHGDPDEQVLRWAEDDARRTRRLLTDLGDVHEDDALLVVNGRRSDVRDAIGRLRTRVRQAAAHGDTLVFVYYSGHGDAEDLHLSGSKLPLHELETWLAELGAATLVTIVDACRNEPSAVRTKGASHVPAFDVQLEQQGGPSGRVMISSAARDEVAQESDKLQSSFFTHHLLSGMRGAADRDGDRQVSLDELYRYAYHHTLVSSHAQLAAVQHPQLGVDLHGQGDLVVTRLSRADALLTLPPELGGDFLFVDDESGQVVAQVYKTEGADLQLALPAGRFRLQLRRGGEIYATEIGLEWGGERKLQARALERQPLRSALAKGPSLDNVAWTLFTQARVGTPPVAGRVAVGAGARLGYDLPSLRVLAGGSLDVSQAANHLQRRAYYQTRVGVAAGPRLGSRLLRLWLGLGAGVIWVHERAVRVGDAGAVRRLGVAPSAHANALGPYLGPECMLQLPLGSDFILALDAELALALIGIDGAMAPRMASAFGLALGRRF